MLSDEELENVSGGTLGETADDSRFLNVLLHKTTKYHQCDRYGKTKLFFSNAACDDVKKAWRSLGIELVYEVGISNNYYLGRKYISREKAWAYAEEKVGKHLTEKDWNW